MCSTKHDIRYWTYKRNKYLHPTHFLLHHSPEPHNYNRMRACHIYVHVYTNICSTLKLRRFISYNQIPRSTDNHAPSLSYPGCCSSHSFSSLFLGASSPVSLSPVDVSMTVTLLSPSPPCSSSPSPPPS